MYYFAKVACSLGGVQVFERGKRYEGDKAGDVILDALLRAGKVKKQSGLIIPLDHITFNRTGAVLTRGQQYEVNSAQDRLLKALVNSGHLRKIGEPDYKPEPELDPEIEALLSKAIEDIGYSMSAELIQDALRKKFPRVSAGIIEGMVEEAMEEEKKRKKTKPSVKAKENKVQKPETK